MRARRIVVVSVVLATLGAGLLLAPPVAATPVHQLQAVNVSPAAVSVSGFGVASVTITATVRADDGVGPCGDEPFAFGVGVAAMMTRTSPAATGVLSSWKVNLSLASGTDTLGTWQATWDVPATYVGTWQVDRILGCTGPAMIGGGQAYFDVRPADLGMAAAVAVAGTKPPTMAITRVPAVAAYGSSQLIRWTFRNANGTRLAGRKIKVGTDVDCGFYAWGDRIATLDSNGSFAIYRSLANAAGKGDRCVLLTTKSDASGAVMLYDRARNRWYFKTVTATVNRGTVAYGSAATVTGAVAPNNWSSSDGPRAGLQRYQNGMWKGVAIVSVKKNGTYALAVKPPTRGTWWFRVIAVPSSYDVQLEITPTKAFAVRAI